MLDVTRDKARELAEGQEVVIVADAGRPVAIFHLREKYVYNKEEMAKKVYGTTDLSHPGVARIKAMGEVLLGSPWSRPRPGCSFVNAAGERSPVFKPEMSRTAATKACKRWFWAFVMVCSFILS